MTNECNEIEEVQIFLTIDTEELIKLGYTETPTKEELCDTFHVFIDKLGEQFKRIRN